MSGIEILAAIEAANHLLKLALQAIARGRERGEWTPEQEQAFALKASETIAQEHWKPKA